MSHNCKHYGKWAILSPVETTSRSLMDKLRKDDELKNLLSNCVLEAELSYAELSGEDKEIADEAWEEHKSVCDECVNNPCPKYCKQNVLDA